MRQTIADEHRALDALLATTRSLLHGDGSASQAREVFEEMCEALEVHLAAEEDLYYPTLWVLCPGHKQSLMNFINAHAGFRQRLEQVAAHMRSEDLEEAARILEEFEADFAGHEIREEHALRSIDRELSKEELI